MSVSIAELEDAWKELALLRQLIEKQGFKVIDGDFTLRDGSRSPFYLKPVDCGVLIARAREALRETCPHINRRHDPNLVVDICKSCGAQVYR